MMLSSRPDLESRLARIGSKKFEKSLGCVAFAFLFFRGLFVSSKNKLTLARRREVFAVYVLRKSYMGLTAAATNCPPSGELLRTRGTPAWSMLTATAA